MFQITLDWASSMEKKDHPELLGRRSSEDIGSMMLGMSGSTFNTADSKFIIISLKPEKN